MNKTLLAMTLVLAPLTIGALNLYGAPPFSLLRTKKAEVKWESDLFAAHKRAMKENKPMLLVFGAEWCGFCKKLENETLTHPELAKYVNESFVPVHLDADKEQKVTEILEVQALPCTVVLSPNADMLGRIDGFFDPGPYYQKISAARQLLDSQDVSQVTAP